MPLGTLPPWLDVRPEQFTQATEQGASLGLQEQQLVQQKQLEEQRLSQSQQEQNQRAGEFQQQQSLEQERQAAAIADNKARTDALTQAAARKAQAQMAYQHAIATGVDPIVAMQQFGPQMGTPLTGLGALGLDQLRTKQASIPPQMIPGPDGTKPAGYTYGGRFYPTPVRATPKVIGLGAKARLAAAQEAVKNAVSDADRQKSMDALDKIAEEVDNPESEADAPATDAPEAKIPKGFMGTPGVTRNLSDLPMPGTATATTPQPSAVPSYTYDRSTGSFSTNSVSQ